MASLIDSAYYRDMFGTADMRSVFSDEQRFMTWLDVEVALACAEARVGVIPKGVAERIAAAAKLENLNLAALKEEYERVGFPILPLVHQLAKACDPEAARWIHWGATTQDIVDTGLVLQMRSGLELIAQDLEAVIAALSRLACKHRDTVMPGRTFQQHAAPITFGFKAAVWLDELRRHNERLPGVKRRALVCQFGGAVGTLATLGNDGLKVLRELSQELGLEEPPITWHTARDGWAELVFWLALVGATLGKIGTEIATLMRSEVNEVREPYQPGRGGSSTMPQKRNPIACPILIAISHRLRESVAGQLTAMIQEHERAVGAMPLEWLVIPDAFVLLSGALKHGREILEHLDVDANQMRKNLTADGGFLMAESVMMGLAPHLGRNAAHKQVTAVAHRAIDEGRTLREGLVADPEIMKHLAVGDIDRLLEPANYLGCAGEMVDAVLARVNAAR